MISDLLSELYQVCGNVSPHLQKRKLERQIRVFFEAEKSLFPGFAALWAAVICDAWDRFKFTALLIRIVWTLTAATEGISVEDLSEVLSVIMQKKCEVQRN